MLLPSWARTIEQGAGRVEAEPELLRLTRRATSDEVYSNAQLDDRAGAAGWRPPLLLTVRARFGEPVERLRGTAGFGFWNAGIVPGSWRIRPPRAVWFFLGAPPFDVLLALGVPGAGFKAATLDAARPGFFALLPLAPLGVLAMRVPALYRRLWPVAQRAIGVSESLLEGLDVTEFHRYTIRWDPWATTFSVDGRTVLRGGTIPGPLRFVAWIDNAYAVATPQGRFGGGLVATDEPQSLEIAELRIDTPADRPRAGIIPV